MSDALKRMNAADVDQFNKYEERIAKLERHNELLRAALDDSILQRRDFGECPACSGEDGEHTDYCTVKAAIDGGALDEDGDK